MALLGLSGPAPFGRQGHAPRRPPATRFGLVHEIEVKHQLGDQDLAAVAELLAHASDADAHPALGEHAWLDLVQGGREGFAGLVAWERGHPHPVGYAQLSLGPRREGGVPSWSLEVVVDPHHRTPGNTIGMDLLQGALELIKNEGGGHLHLWVNQPAPYHDRMAASAGLSPGRVLYQMRRPLPGPEQATIRTRAFRPGQDEQAWLEVNNRAFRNHPEQGGWTMYTIRQREAQPWFDAEGFLLYEEGGRLAGFCWTKVHSPRQPGTGGGASHEPPHSHGPPHGSPEAGQSPRGGQEALDRHGAPELPSRGLGEIYVVAVHPDFSGKGLGRQLTLAGLDYLAHRGLTEAMLYVDAANLPAVKLYVELGFAVDHIDRAYTADVAGDTKP